VRKPSFSVSEAFVRFSFSLEKNEIEEVIETSSKSIFSKSKNNPVARAKEKNLTLILPRWQKLWTRHDSSF
jgi:hypothetical protein